MSLSIKRLCSILMLFLAASLLLACQIANLVSSMTAGKGSSPPTRTLAPIRTAATPTKPPAVEAIPPTAEPEPTEAPPAVMATAKGNLRVRAGPSTQDQIVDRLADGATVQVVGRNMASDWLQIALPSNPDERGWISAEFVDLSGPVDDLVVVEQGGGQ